MIYYYYYYHFFIIKIIYIKKNLSKKNSVYGLRVWPFRMASAVLPKPIEKQPHVWPSCMTSAYGFPYDPRMAMYLKKLCCFLVWPFRMASSVLPKPIEKQPPVWPPRMTFTYDFAYDSRMALQKSFFDINYCTSISTLLY